MLYQIYETQRSLLEPFADFALAASKLCSNPSSPFQKVPLAQRISASYDLMYRLGKDYEKPEFGIKTVSVDGVDVAIHERVEVTKPFCELRRFKRFSDDPATLLKLKGQPAVLIVAPLSGHYATLLRDTVRTMLKDHKVYITDWTNARLVPLSEGEFHLDDYVNYVQEFIRHLQATYGNCHVMSVCQPTVPVLAAVSLMASRGEKVPLSMTMMGGPIDARKSPTVVNDLAENRSFEWFENNVIYRVPGNFPGAGRLVYPGFLQYTGFIAMNPKRHAVNHYDYFKNLIKGDEANTEAHRVFYDEYNAVLDMDADFYLETIKTVFQEFHLMHGTWDVRSAEGKIERVRPQDIRNSAVLTVEGELDDIAGLGQTRAAHDLCKGIASKEQRHLTVEGAGHYGIFSGSRWRNVVYPKVRDFILEHQKPLKQAQAAAAPVAKAEKPATAATALVAKRVAKPAVPAAPVAAKTAVKVAKAVAPAAPQAATPKKPAAKKAAPPARQPKPAAKVQGGTPPKAVVASQAATGPSTRWVGPAASNTSPVPAAGAVPAQATAVRPAPSASAITPAPAAPDKA